MSMGMADKDEAASSPSPDGMVQAEPGPASWMREADTRQMIHDIQGRVEGLHENVRAIDARQERDSRKLDGIDRHTSGITDLSAKLDDVLGFIKHGVPNLATKADISDLRGDLSHRPTRRQAITDLITFVGLIAAAMGIAVHFAK